MTQCFCGCGMRVRILRSVNKRGTFIRREVEHVSKLLDRGLVSLNAEEFVREGRDVCHGLAQAMHDCEDPDRALEMRSRGFLGLATERFSAPALERAIERSDMTHAEAWDALVLGQWDPFADVPVSYEPVSREQARAQESG